MSAQDYDGLVIKAAETFRLDANLIRAICTVESSWNPESVRYEKDWHYFNSPRQWADKLGVTYEHESINQSTSWGLGQVMGALARDLGFTMELEMLKDPTTGLYYCAKNLHRLFQTKMCNNEEDKVISSYNQGSPRMTEGGMFENQVYVDKVSAVLRDLRKLI